MEPVIGVEDRVFANIQIAPNYKNIILFIENLKQKLSMDDTYDIECSYEAVYRRKRKPINRGSPKCSLLHTKNIIFRSLTFHYHKNSVNAVGTRYEVLTFHPR